MKKLTTKIAAFTCAMTLLCMAGCGDSVPEDPDAAKNELGDKVADPGDPEGELDSKGEKQHKPKDKGE